MNPADYLTVADIAEREGVTTSSIRRNLMEGGRFDPEPVFKAGRWFFHPDTMRLVRRPKSSPEMREYWRKKQQESRERSK